MFLSRSSKTLEFLDLVRKRFHVAEIVDASNADLHLLVSHCFQGLVPFYTSSYFSSDAPLRTMFFDHTKPKPTSTNSDELPPPRVLEFPLLKTLSLAPLDLTSPVAIKLLRTSPLLEHLSLTHEPTANENGTTANIDLPPLPNLISLRFGSMVSSEEGEDGSRAFLDVVESLRGTTSLEALDIAETGSNSFVDGTRLLTIASGFPNLTALSLCFSDWRCSMVRLSIYYLYASMLICFLLLRYLAQNEISSVLSNLKSLTTFVFDLDPNLTDPPHLVPEANANLFEDGDIGPPEYIIGEISESSSSSSWMISLRLRRVRDSTLT